MTNQRRHFDISLELEVVRIIKDQGLSASQVSQSMNIGETTINRWLNQNGVQQEGGLGTGTPLTTYQQRIFQLEQENRQLRMDMTISKNASAFPPAELKWAAS